jgi:hypothetical protein
MKTGGWPILVFLLTVVSSPWCRSAEPISEQEKAVAEVNKLHGEIKYDLTNPDKPIVQGIYFRGNTQDFTDERLVFLKTFTELKYLTIMYSKITDVFMDNLANMKSLEQLHLSGSLITDAGLERLKGLTKLKKLRMIGSREITAHGLKYLKDLKELEYLSLAASEKITDEGMENFEAFQKLNTLQLCATGIHGKGLYHLIGLKQFRKLDLSGNFNNIDDNGVKYLKEMKQLVLLDLGNNNLPMNGLSIIGHSLPKCRVLWYWGTSKPFAQEFQSNGREWLK